MTNKRFHVYEDKKVKFERNDRYGVHDGKIIFKPFLDLEEAEKYCNLLNELNDENEELKQQMQRLYNYFADWFDDRVPSRDFSEMWDNVKKDEKWD